MNWINPIISFSAYLGIFMALVIGLQKSTSARRNQYFALIIGLLSIQILKNVATDQLGLALPPALYLALQGTCLFIGPAVYLYVRHMISSEPVRAWPHFRLGAIYILFIICLVLLLQSFESLKNSITPPLAVTLGYTVMFGQIYHVLWYFQRTLTRLKWHEEADSLGPVAPRLKWMKASVWLMAAIIVLLIIPFLLITALGELSLLAYLKQGFLLAISFAINYSAIQSFNRPEIVLTMEPKVTIAGWKTTEWEQLDKDLQHLMLVKKPHLSSQLRLKDMADLLQVPPGDLSRFMNQHCQISFTGFINRHRVKEAEKLLLDEEQGYSVIEVALEAGFNSKATFNRVFKEQTGLTPSDFRKRARDVTTDRATF